MMTLKKEHLPQKSEDIKAWLITHLSEFLNMSPEEIDEDEPFESFGMSSREMVMLSGDLEEWLGVRLEPTLVWQYPTIDLISRYLAGEVEENSPAKSKRGEPISEPVAVIGIGCRFPGSDGPDGFWDLLINGIDAISEASPDRWENQDYYDPELASPGSLNTLWGGFLQDVDRFDNELFKISPREAVRMDPQQRLLLEVAWEALEHAGQAPQKLSGSSTGVFIGISTSDYSMLQFADPDLIDAYAGTGNAHSIAANRLSYFFDLHGPSIAVDTACSSSLVALHLAVQGLKNGECDLALAGGVNLILTPELTITFSQARMMASDGRCKTFDSRADGYVRGEGCGMVVLKRLSDAVRDQDHIVGLIRGTAINHDGRSNGLTAPNGLIQQAVIRQALSNAGVEPHQIGYLEAHGTGTRLGDPIEFDALKAVFTDTLHPGVVCALGSVKTNIGHLEAAAGVAGLIKALLTLQHGTIPPHLHLQTLNPLIALDGTPFVIPTSPQAWPVANQHPRYAGVSSFGFGGTNAHVVLEAPEDFEIDYGQPEETPANHERPIHVLALSARSESTLKALSQRYVDFLSANLGPKPTIPNICYTANTGRQHFDTRLAVVCDEKSTLMADLTAFIEGRQTGKIAFNHIQDKSTPQLAFLFTGQGSQYIGMGRQLYDTEPAFRNTLDICDAITLPYLGQSLLSVIFADEETSALIHETAYTQPALFALEFALADLLRTWGIQPNLVLGHSIGEYAAACFAGAFSLKDGLRLVLERGRLMQSLPRDGSMAVVFADMKLVAELVNQHPGQVSISAINGPTNIVISGENTAVQDIVKAFTDQGVECRSLEVSHAFHSPLMEPILDTFSQTAEQIEYHPLQISLASNLSGQMVQAGGMLSADYWVRHIRQPVQFTAGMNALTQHGVDIYVEIGPAPVLLGMGKRCLPKSGAEWLPTLRKGQSDWQNLLSSLGTLYTRGLLVDWDAFDHNFDRKRLPLPSYPFERKPFWFEGSPRARGKFTGKIAGMEGAQTNWLHQLVWDLKVRSLDFHAATPPPMSWILFADEGGLGQMLGEQITQQGDACIYVYPGQDYQHSTPTQYHINPAQKDDFKQLFEATLESSNPPCLRIIHLWSLNSSFSLKDPLTSLQDGLDLGCESALHLVQALGEFNQLKDNPLSIWFVTRGAQQIGPEPGPIAVSQAPLWGFARTLALEYPDLWGGLVDLDPTAPLEEVTQLWDSFSAPDQEDQVAFRGGDRYVARLEPYLAPTESPQDLPCRADAAYLITGGTGALGLNAAQRLIERGARHLVLASRTEFPSPNTWDQIGPEHPLQGKIAGIRKLRETGANIHLVSVDVADQAQMAELLQNPHHDWPAIRGVIHMAGVIEAQPIRQLTPENLTYVLRPKVYGTWWLHDLLKDVDLDFFVLFSSAASLLNSPMLSAYAAANAFLDAIAHYRRSLGLPALSINWGFWEDGGMAVQYQKSIGRTLVPKGMQPIPVAKGLDILEALIMSGEAQVGVIPNDWQTWSRYQPRISTLPLLSNLIIAQPQPVEFPGLTGPASKPHQGIAGKPQVQDITSLPPEQRLDYLLTYIKQTIANALHVGANELSPDENLMELGLDSLMVMELTGNLERDFYITVYPREVFERPTIQSFAAYLESEIIRLQPETATGEKSSTNQTLVTSRATSAGYLGIPIGIGDYHQPQTRSQGVAFILSSPRSGSTLLRVMLAGHPNIFCPPELHLLPFDSMKSRREILGESYLDEGLTRVVMEVMGMNVSQSKAMIQDWTEKDLPVEAVYEILLEKVKPQLLVDKSPSYAYRLEALERAELLFESPKYIFLSRHPYAMMESFVRNRFDKLLGVESGDPLDIAEQIWATMNANVLDFFDGLDPARYHTVQFEDLVAEPGKSMTAICDFLGLPFDEAILKPYGEGRMTDGIHASSVPIGDPNFLKHDGIDPELGQIWKTLSMPRRLGGFARRVAQELKYDLPESAPKSKPGIPPEEIHPLNQGPPEITPLSRDRHRVKTPPQGNLEITDSLSDDLFGGNG
jgi:acyl transferase domain-containing protein/acyl carrier protein